MTLLSVNNVSVTFGGVNAVSNVSLELQDNTLLGFIGPNGAGKTTLMRIITGVLRPRTGRVYFLGDDITDWPVHRRVASGMALGQQLVKPLKSLSLLDNVTLAVGREKMSNPLMALLKTNRREEQKTARSLLDMVGIADASESRPDELPLGYLKRAELARALALKPRLLLLDEPLAGLNQTEARAMADLVASLVNSQRSVILIEHNIREVARICAEIYVQDNGKRLLLGPADDIMQSPELRSAYLGEAGTQAQPDNATNPSGSPENARPNTYDVQSGSAGKPAEGSTAAGKQNGTDN